MQSIKIRHQIAKLQEPSYIGISAKHRQSALFDFTLTCPVG
jgi:hypothetical protein